MLSRICTAAFVACLTVVQVPAMAQADVPSTAVNFKKGTSSATVQGKLQGNKVEARD